MVVEVSPLFVSCSCLQSAQCCVQNQSGITSFRLFFLLLDPHFPTSLRGFRNDNMLSIMLRGPLRRLRVSAIDVDVSWPVWLVRSESPCTWRTWGPSCRQRRPSSASPIASSPGSQPWRLLPCRRAPSPSMSTRWAKAHALGCSSFHPKMLCSVVRLRVSFTLGERHGGLPPCCTA